ncbi:MAG: TVP38/TMEM64 family protein [Candidatus Cyclobacteriaceae bacterium M3_2C_046]
MDQNQKENQPEEEIKQSKWPLYLSAAILVGLTGAYFLIPSFQDFLKEAYQVLTSDNKDRISEWVGQLGIWGPVFIMLTMILQMFLLVIPSPLLMVVAVLAYGPIWGVVISIASIFLASSVGYIIGRYLGQVTVDRLIGHKKEQKLEFYIDRYGFWAVIITRLSPLFSNDAISFVGGILRMGYFRFIFATLAGITPLAILIAYFGENNDRLKDGMLWTSLISLALLIVYIIYDRNKNPADKQKKPSTTAKEKKVNKEKAGTESG